jgi:hypothetical protein
LHTIWLDGYEGPLELQGIKEKEEFREKALKIVYNTLSVEKFNERIREKIMKLFIYLCGFKGWILRQHHCDKSSRQKKDFILISEAVSSENTKFKRAAHRPAAGKMRAPAAPIHLLWPAFCD